jgi:lipopolysaccharide transport system ATP-binding protein
MSTVISVENVSKLYYIGRTPSAGANRHGSLRESLAELAADPLRLIRRNGHGAAEELWALKDVNFSVEEGEILGIIGQNGAGKSTLLKILSRITDPTTGRITMKGRVGSLIEVGTGFHPELTGRENVFLNGAILGMKRSEIKKKFDQIVAFSGVERFLDTAVKFYSSGMYMRLAFAVAAHLEPDILLVDEVLAVGDTEFQRKCLTKINELANGGRTVLYVSHALGSLSNLCTRAMLLSSGHKSADGVPDEVIEEYIGGSYEHCGEKIWPDRDSAPGNRRVRLHAIRVLTNGEITPDVDIQDDIEIQVEYWNLDPDLRIMISIHLFDKTRVGVLSSGNMHSANLGNDEWFNEPHPVGLYRSHCTIPGNFLNEGRYLINALIMTNVKDVEARVDEVLSFEIHDSGGMRKEWKGYWLGVVRPRLTWQTERLS